ncbi:MAG: hypothetical protein HKO63_00010 [Acidimicrobiia bacterium]|nr:hypothetical protein [Acidimicrobiia bacterium]
MFLIFGGLIQLLFWGAVIFGIVKLVQGAGSRSEDAPMTVKRLFVFGSLYAALHVAAWGVAGLIAALGEDAADRGEQAAAPLAMTVVGLPVLFLLARWVWRSLPEFRDRGAAFSLYLNLSLVTALVVVMVAAVAVADWLVGGASYSGIAVGALTVWAPIWVVHWRLFRTEQTSVSNFHVYVGATAGLATMAGFGGALLGRLLTRLLDSGTDVALTSRTHADVATWLVGFAVGAAVFAWYWIQTGMREPRDTLWHTYVVLIGVLGGLITAVTGAAISLYSLLQWWFGESDYSSAVRHFDTYLVPAGGALVVGLIVWLYHRRVLGPVRGDRTDVHRVYDYVVAAVGLVTAVVGVIILVIGFQEAVFPPDDSRASEANMLLGAVTALAVGVPLWAQAWRRINHARRTDDTAEVASPVRRSYLFGLVGVSGVIGLVSLIILLVVVFGDLLGEGGDPLRNDVQIPIALLFATGVVAVYHFLLVREERDVETAREHPKHVMLVTGHDELAAAVRELTGARVTLLHRLDTNGEADDPAVVAAAIESSEYDDLLVVPGPTGAVEVIPYRR